MPSGQNKMGNHQARPSSPRPDAVTEVVLLLAEDQVKALLAAAKSGGVTAGSLIRRILNKYLSAERDRAGRAARRAGVAVESATRLEHPGAEGREDATGGQESPPVPELSSRVWEFLDRAWTELDAATDMSAVCSAVVRLGVPVLGRSCEVTRCPARSCG
ncbi:MAG: hypothetical protein JWO38_1339 [Gemmataceae bacterium]|nr:hypothetical protein [Gemmataceae bacterium]